MGEIVPDEHGVTITVDLKELYERHFIVTLTEGTFKTYVGNAIHWAVYEILKEKAPHLIKKWKSTELGGDGKVTLRYEYEE